MGTRTREATGETLRVPPRNRRKQGRLYHRSTGKSTEGARGADGSVVALKRGQACGAKGPYGLERF
jgi:hypothetical protein